MRAPMIIRTNSAVDVRALAENRDGQPITFDATKYYRSQVKRSRDGDVVLTFETGGSTGTLSVREGTFSGVARTYLHWEADHSLTADLEPGVYIADYLVIGEPDQSIEFPVVVEKGITTP